MAYKDPEKAKAYKRDLYKKRKVLYGSRKAAYAGSKENEKSYLMNWRKTEAGMRHMRSAHLRLKYGITIEQFEDMLEFQGNKCLLCEETFDSENRKGLRRAVLDHDHACCPDAESCGKCIRGIIHQSCNSGIGFFDDDIGKLKLAIMYLERSNDKSK